MCHMEIMMLISEGSCEDLWKFLKHFRSALGLLNKFSMTFLFLRTHLNFSNESTTEFTSSWLEKLGGIGNDTDSWIRVRPMKGFVCNGLDDKYFKLLNIMCLCHTTSALPLWQKNVSYGMWNPQGRKVFAPLGKPWESIWCFFSQLGVILGGRKGSVLLGDLDPTPSSPFIHISFSVRSEW